MANCTISGTVSDPSGTGITGAIVKAVLSKPQFVSTTLYVPYEVSTTTAAGAWSLAVVQGLSISLSISYPPNSTDSTRIYNYAVTVPATSTATFSSIAVET